MTKDERWEQALADLNLLSIYRFTGSVRFSMTGGVVSLATLQTLKRLADLVESETESKEMECLSRK